MLECFQSAAFKLYQRNLQEKALCIRDNGLSCIDKLMNEGKFDRALTFYEQAKGKLSVIEVLDIMPSYEVGVWRNALESRLALIDKAKRYDHRHYATPEKRRSK